MRPFPSLSPRARALPITLAPFVFWACAVVSAFGEEPKRPMTFEPPQPQSFGKLDDGTMTHKFVCKNKNGLIVELTDYGARIVAVMAPDRDGELANVALGLDSGPAYAKHSAFFGCTTGRYANRIAKGKFSLNGKTYSLATNNDPNHLHGGLKGFDRQVWKAEPIATTNAVGVKFTHRSPDGDEGYPGTLEIAVTYSLTDDDELKIEYEAQTNQATILNLTNHCYWNLGGAGSGTVLDHQLTLNADRYVEPDATLIPTGRLLPVQGTPLDFTKTETIGARIAKLKEGEGNPGGYDHCYVINGQPGTLRLAARAYDPKSGRTMEVRTTEPGVQLYTGNFLDGSKTNGGFEQHGAFCLETQHYPDSPNRPEFPTTTLKPGETYRQTTVHKFSVK